MILGSGWSEAARAFDICRRISYVEIPGLGNPDVPGHAGELLLANAEGRELLIFLGRHHWYEGRGWDPVAIPVYICRCLGASLLLLTNAAGGIREDLAPGDLMIVADHINALGTQPLIGPHDPVWGSRFPDMTQVYDPDLQRLIMITAQELGLKVHRGVYLATTGPAYETPAEVAAFRALGADAVGMSTVPEALLAHAAGIRVGAICCIANRAACGGQKPLAHADVLEVLQSLAPRLGSLLRNVWKKMVHETAVTGRG
ncbi:MAG: purine-nucleoside phosphorylase [Kiritimatiellia bacterium]